MPNPQPPQGGSRPGVMGDWTEEQNLGQPGNPKDRISKEDVEAAFDKTDDKSGSEKPHGGSDKAPGDAGKTH